MNFSTFGLEVDKVFVSVYMSLQRRTQQLQNINLNIGPVAEGAILVLNAVELSCVRGTLRLDWWFGAELAKL